MPLSHEPPKHIVNFEKIVLEAVRKAMIGVAPEDHAQALLNLRAELERCLHQAPTSGDVVEAVHFRAKLAAAIDKALHSIQDGI